MDLSKLVEQCLADSQRWFPQYAEDLVHRTLCLVGEAGEMANVVKKVAQGTVSLDNVRDKLGEEAVDVLIYLCNIFAVLGIDPVQVYTEKRAKNELRFGHGPLSVLIDNNPGGIPSPPNSGHYCLSDDCCHGR